MSRPVRLPVHAIGPDGRLVVLTAGTLMIGDSTTALLRGDTLVPRSRGITNAGAHIGAGDGGVGVHVYQRVDSLSAIDTMLHMAPRQRLFAVPLALRPGEFRRQALPPGEWMLTMLPEADSAADGIKLHIEGAACRPNLLSTPRRYGCTVRSGATVTVYRPLTRGEPSSRTGYLLVRWLFS